MRIYVVDHIGRTLHAVERESLERAVSGAGSNPAHVTTPVIRDPLTVLDRTPGLNLITHEILQTRLQLAVDRLVGVVQ
jgi:hypothetical protein